MTPEESGKRIADRAIIFAGELAAIAVPGLAETCTVEARSHFSWWTLTWWLGTMLVTIAGAAFMCFGWMWWAIGATAVALASCFADAAYGLWED